LGPRIILAVNVDCSRSFRTLLLHVSSQFSNLQVCLIVTSTKQTGRDNIKCYFGNLSKCHKAYGWFTSVAHTMISSTCWYRET